nr:MAG TPA: adenine-specific methyltransferase [Caudoviricetes sp.]
MSKNNKSLQVVKNVKNDEFYTQISYIENELQCYVEHFEEKVVYCNCDNPMSSNFWLYFVNNFNNLKLRKLIATHYKTNQPSTKSVMTKTGEIEVTNLIGNGDFRSDECIELLKESDIIVTNPPFSLFRDHMDLIFKYNKKFIILGSLNAVTYTNVFPFLAFNKM